MNTRNLRLTTRAGFMYCGVEAFPEGLEAGGLDMGEPPEDPLLLFSVLYGFWVTNYVAFNGDVIPNLAAEFLALVVREIFAPQKRMARPVRKRLVHGALLSLP